MVTGKVSPLAVSESIELSEEIAETEVKLNEDAIIEEDDEEDPLQENDEEISDEEIFDEEDEEEDKEEEENNNENQIEEIIIEEKKEENNNDENDIKEVTEEKKEAENNNDNAIQELSEEKKIDTAIDVELSNEKKEEEKKEEENKEEGKTEPVSKNPVKTEPISKKSKKRIRKKKNDNKDKPKPEPSVKTPPAKKAKISAAAKDGEEEGPTSVTKDEKEGKKGKDKPETPGKKVESMGMIFMCSSKTKKDCYQYKVFGLPAGKKETVQKIYKGMRLFLYDIDLKLMYGIYKASAPGGFNLEPKAFNSAYPSQVRFTVMEDCEPLGEEKFKTVIKDNYYSKNKFNPQLNSDQVKNLCKLFAFANKSSTPKSKKPDRNLKSAPVEPRQPSGRGRKILKRVQDEPNRPPRSPRRFARRNPERRQFDRRPVGRYPVDYHLDDRRVVYEREAFVQPPPPMVPPLSYSYETEAYRRDLPPLENRGRSYLDYEQTSRDRYYYREREPIPYAREYGYAPAPAPAAAEYNYLPAPALPPPRYSYPDPATSDYRSTEGMRADYRIPAAAEGRYSDYRSSARDRVYRL